MLFWGHTNLRDSASFLSQELMNFHDFILMILTLILSFVSVIMVNMVMNPFVAKKLTSHHGLEFIWTLLPALVLIAIATPSLVILYIIEDASLAVLTYKVTGHQWYWTYASSNLTAENNQVVEDSFMIKESDGPLDLFRLLDTSYPLTLAPFVTSRLLVTSDDVLHSWTVPGFGVKVDACPGRINEVVVHPTRRGMFFGNCSEICGSNHSYMPIQVVAAS